MLLNTFLPPTTNPFNPITQTDQYLQYFDQQSSQAAATMQQILDTAGLFSGVNGNASMSTVLFSSGGSTSGILVVSGAETIPTGWPIQNTLDSDIALGIYSLTYAGMAIGNTAGDLTADLIIGFGMVNEAIGDVLIFLGTNDIGNILQDFSNPLSESGYPPFEKAGAIMGFIGAFIDAFGDSFKNGGIDFEKLGIKLHEWIDANINPDNLPEDWAR
jgi:hypothetical protein